MLSIEIDKEKMAFMVGKALDAAEKRAGLFSEGIFRPEEPFINMAKEYGRLNNKPEFAANAVFLTTSLVFADDTEMLFRRISDLTKLNEYAWIFDPKIACSGSDLDIVNAAYNFFRPAGYNIRVLAQWPYNLRILESFNGDIRNFFDQFNGDPNKIIAALEVRPRAKTEEKIKANTFTRYGPKISALVVQWMKQYGLYQFNDQNGRVPVDFQVARTLIQTGCAALERPQNAYQVTSQIGLALGELSQENGWPSRNISETLWNIGNRGCSKRKHEPCPINDNCKTLISRKPYDRDGLFDPKDTGRWK